MNNEFENFVIVSRDYLSYLRAEKVILKKELKYGSYVKSEILKEMSIVEEDIGYLESFDEIITGIETLKELYKNGDIYIDSMNSLKKMLYEITKNYAKNEKIDKVIEEHGDVFAFLEELENKHLSLVKEMSHNFLENDEEFEKSSEKVEEVRNFIKYIKEYITKDCANDVTKLQNPKISNEERENIYKNCLQAFALAYDNESFNLQTVASRHEFENWFYHNYQKLDYDTLYVNTFARMPIKIAELDELYNDNSEKCLSKTR